MDQRYVDTVRACKVILHNLGYLEENLSEAQRAELERVMQKVIDRMYTFLESGEEDEGLWIGEE